MNNGEALEILNRELASVCEEPHAQLARRIGSGPLVLERDGPSGTAYQLEIECIWDDRPGGNIRVMASIDDGGWRAFVPLTRSCLKSADESSVGE